MATSQIVVSSPSLRVGFDPMWTIMAQVGKRAIKCTLTVGRANMIRPVVLSALDLP